MEGMRQRSNQSLQTYAAILFSLTIFWLFALQTAVEKSPAVDEPVHLLRGYALRQIGDLRQQFQHTPLSHRLIGMLLLTGSDNPDIEQLATWSSQDRPDMSAELLWQSSLDATQFLFLGRIPIIWLGLLLGALMGQWAKQQNGRVAMMAVLILYACSPNLLASAALATTDFTAAATYFAAVWAWWYYWQEPSWGRWAVAGICLGLGLAAKLTGFLLLPITGLLSYAYWRPGRSWWRPSLIWASLLPVAALTVWFIYGFEIGRPPGIQLTLPAPTYVYTWQEVLKPCGTRA